MQDPPIEPAWQRLLTVDEYHRLVGAGVFDEDEHVELLEGVLVAMSPQGFRHAAIISALNEILVEAREPHQRVRVQLPLTLRRSEPEPDVAVVDKAEERGHHPTTAHLVIEVAGDESLKKDRTIKRMLYAEASVTEYWIMSLDEHVVDVFRDPDPASREFRTRLVAKPGDVLRPVALPRAEVVVAVLFDVDTQ